MNIRNEIIEKYPEETFLFADGFDEAIIGIDSKFIVCYDQDKCIEILARECQTEEDASEYFWYNVEGSYMGEKTPRFIKRFQIIKPNIDLDVSAEHNMSNKTEVNPKDTDGIEVGPWDGMLHTDEEGNEYIYESPDGKKIYRRKLGEYDKRERIDSDIEFGEGEGHD